MELNSSGTEEHKAWWGSCRKSDRALYADGVSYQAYYSEVNVINLADGFIAEIVVTLLLVFARELAPWPDGLDGVNEQLMQGRDDLG
jgi:hypothetical protein